jgi:hypothetical protein
MEDLGVANFILGVEIKKYQVNEELWLNNN